MPTTEVLVTDVHLSLVLFTLIVHMYRKQMTFVCLHVAQGVEGRMRRVTLKLTLCYLEFQIRPQAGEKNMREKIVYCLSAGDN